MKLQGRAALITGAGSGIGRATAELFAGEGAGVAILDRDGRAAESAASDISAVGGEAYPVVADVSSADEVARAVARAARFLGRLDIVYNNAGVGSTGSVADITEEDWDLCFAVNVKGTYLTSQAAIPHLEAAGGGSIINQASVAALVGIPGFSAYSAAKGAVVSLTRAMALDLAPMGIRVNALCPGTVYTPLMEPLMRERGGGSVERGLEITAAKYPIGRIGTPMEIAQAALFLASDDASFVTGAAFTVDGGMTAQ
ncbi:MAG: SDR family NAD(P)-dependent oxidoreductase [bacterium]|nr:SDR family NAD(P)-dependent oxidoreductase [bacterium]